jgi:hypothetical protein
MGFEGELNSIGDMDAARIRRISLSHRDNRVFIELS